MIEMRVNINYMEELPCASVVSQIIAIGRHRFTFSIHSSALHKIATVAAALRPRQQSRTEAGMRRAGIIHFVSALHSADIVDKNDVRRFVGQVQADENTHNVLDRLYVSVSALSAKTNTAWQRCAHV